MTFSNMLYEMLQISLLRIFFNLFELIENLSKISKKKRWIESFYFKYLIKMFSYDLILEVDYISI